MYAAPLALCHFLRLQHVQILAALRLGDIAQADLLQDLLGNVQRHVRPGAAHLAATIAPAIGLLCRLGGGSSRLLVTRLLQPDLLQDADQQFVDIVLDARRRLDELGVARLGERFALCARDGIIICVINIPVHKSL